PSPQLRTPRQSTTAPLPTRRPGPTWCSTATGARVARRRKAPAATDPFTPVIEFYHNRLTAPAPPMDALKYPPVTIGPTWRRTPDGRYWDLPERTIGWDVLAWTGVYLRNGREPWRWTDEQARF